MIVYVSLIDEKIEDIKIAKHATKFIKKLTSTPDPFIRGGKGVTDGEIRAGGVKVDKAIKGRAAQKYVSYGKIVSLVLGEALAGKGDLQLVFSSNG